MEAEHKLIPWCVGSLNEFLYYCCPECDSKSSSEKLFLSHAVSEHPLSIAYLVKFNVEQYENYENESISPSLDIKEETSSANDEKIEIVKHEHDMVEYYSEVDCYVSIERLKDETISRHLNGSDFVDELIQQKYGDDEEFETEIKNEGESDYEYDDIGTDATDFLDESYQDRTVPKFNKKKIHCDICGLVVSSTSNLKRHKFRLHTQKSEENLPEDRRNSNKGKYNCDICGMNFCKPFSLKRHKLRIHSKKFLTNEEVSNEWICNYCGNEFKSQYNLRDHVRGIHETSKEPIVVEILSKDYTVEMTHHNVSKPNQSEFKCDVCQMTFNHVGPLHTHKLRKHPENPTNWLCYYCGKEFNCQKNMKDHVREIHENPKLMDLKDQNDCAIKENPVCSNEDPIPFEDDNVDMNDDISKPSQSFKCDVCQMNFNHAGTLHTHKLRIHSVNSWICDYCGKEFNCRKNKRDHVRMIHERHKKVIVIKGSQKDLKDEKDFEIKENHVDSNEEPILPEDHNEEMNDDLSKSSPSKFNCDICHKFFNSAGTLHTHKLRKHTENPEKWICEQCGKEFNCRKNMKDHVREIHEKSKERKECEFCKKPVVLSNYEKHVRIQHMGDKPYKCDQCDKTYGTKSHLRLHEKITHKNERFQCDECGMSLTTYQSLRKHIQVKHRGIPLERKHKCQQCDKAFPELPQLKAHIKIDHDKILAFSCDKCPKQFTRKGGLIKHLQSVHGNVRNYQCRFCEKAFSGKYTLYFHEKGVHFKIKDIGCYVCNQMFSRPHHLHNHLDKIHNIEISYLDMKKKLEKLNSEKCENVPDSHESSQVEMI